MSRQTLTTGTARPGRLANVALWVGQVIVATSFVMASIPKLTLDPITVDGFAAIGFSPTGTVVIGILEVAGVVGLLIPRLCGFTATCAVALMIGAITLTLANLPASLAVFPTVIGVIAALVAYGRRDRTAQLIGTVRHVVAH